MERLERKIRKELIEEKTDELYQDMLTPEYTAKMKDLVEGYINGLLAGVKEMVSPSELAIFEIEMKAQMNKNVFEPSALKKQAVQAAKRYYGSRAETEYMLESERSKLEGLINTEAMEKIKDAETPFWQLQT